MNILYNDQKNTALLVIKNFVVSEEIASLIQESWLSPKQEVHITLIWYDTGELITALSADDIAMVKETVMVGKYSIGLRNTYAFIQKEIEQEIKDGTVIPEHHRKAIIQHIQIKWIEKLYEKLRKVLWVELSIPFGHITIATSSTYKPYMQKWISLYSDADYNTCLVTEFGL